MMTNIGSINVAIYYNSSKLPALLGNYDTNQLNNGYEGSWVTLYWPKYFCRHRRHKLGEVMILMPMQGNL